MRKTIVTNTSPLIAIVAATGDLTLLKNLQLQTLVPYEVAQEIRLDSMAIAIQRMQKSGIRLSQGVIQFAMARSGEIH